MTTYALWTWSCEEERWVQGASYPTWRAARLAREAAGVHRRYGVIQPLDWIPPTHHPDSPPGLEVFKRAVIRDTPWAYPVRRRRVS